MIQELTMKQTIINELMIAGIDPVGIYEDLPKTIENAVETVKALGYDAWLKTTTMGRVLKAIVKKLSELKPLVFETGKTYSTPSICDHECIFEYTIISRTEKSVKVKTNTGIKSRKIHLIENIETIFPEGRYSMCPVLKAL
jgi:hypothetical protein